MRQIDANELQQCIAGNKPLKLLDVREPIEFHTFNIGGQNIPVKRIAENLDSILYNKTDEIIVVCSAGIRSATAQHILIEHGYQYAINLKGGLKALQKLNK